MGLKLADVDLKKGTMRFVDHKTAGKAGTSACRLTHICKPSSSGGCNA